jgi:succinyl-CoA synthetase beta subunit
VIVFSADLQGGMDIEAVAHDDPAAIITLPIDIRTGPTDENLTFLAKKLGFAENLIPTVCRPFYFTFYFLSLLLFREHSVSISRRRTS